MNQKIEKCPAEALRLAGISKSFGSVHAVREVNLSVFQGEFFSLLGPSGCGKTTLLRLVAGLEMPNSGSIHIGGADATSVPPHLRSVNTVFQSYALFPHLTVIDNISFGLRMKKRPRPEIKERVEKVMTMMHIETLAARKPDQISGGQKQRVALARALVNEPNILLLDEPFAAIDFKLRKELQAELRDLQRRLRTTFIYVTHDQEEALVMSDRLAVMKDGGIEQVGGPREIYESPKTQFVAQFVGGCNIFQGNVIGRSVDETIVRTDFGDLRTRSSTPSKIGDSIILAVRPEKIEIGEGDQAVRGVVKSAAFTGPTVQYEISVRNRVIVVTTANNRHARRAEPGEAISLNISPDSLIALVQSGP